MYYKPKKNTMQIVILAKKNFNWYWYQSEKIQFLLALFGYFVYFCGQKNSTPGIPEE